MTHKEWFEKCVEMFSSLDKSPARSNTLRFEGDSDKCVCHIDTVDNGVLTNEFIGVLVNGHGFVYDPDKPVKKPCMTVTMDDGSVHDYVSEVSTTISGAKIIFTDGHEREIPFNVISSVRFN